MMMKKRRHKVITTMILCVMILLLLGSAFFKRYELRFTVSESMTPVLHIGAISLIDKKNVTAKKDRLSSMYVI